MKSVYAVSRKYIQIGFYLQINRLEVAKNYFLMKHTQKHYDMTWKLNQYVNKVNTTLHMRSDIGMEKEIIQQNQQQNLEERQISSSIRSQLTSRPENVASVIQFMKILTTLYTAKTFQA
ncbi:Hypothetical_protein [Hexamita inflata]|uniref:Hypothetical_protein n=1 Tax=Hexamita inflata TaxID=28002 RepID=A0AA86TWW9_9EUKA|nr:Hypothetical protein HINF_LOCUS19950 [Hexamita inflata]